MFLAVSAFDTLYQFWIHTRLVGRLGPLEWVLNTPSHHRVHHARNPRYIDRNHGGTLIVWDRLFGTFARGEDEPVYGITKPLASFNPLWANLHYWAEMWDVARRARRPLDRLRVLWMRPGWRPADLGGPLGPTEVDRASYVKFDVPLARRGEALRARAVRGGAAWRRRSTCSRATRSPPAARVAGAVRVAWSLSSLGGLLDRRPWARAARGGRGWRSSALLGGARPARSGRGAGSCCPAVRFGLWLARALAKGASPRRPRCARIAATSPYRSVPPRTRSYGHCLRVVPEVHGLDGALPRPRRQPRNLHGLRRA